MTSVNKVILIGNVGQLPEVRMMQNGKQVATFPLATSTQWTDKQTGESKSVTEWHRITIFKEGVIPIIQNYVRKGSKLYLEGEIKTRKYTDNKGIERFVTEIVIQGFQHQIMLLDRKQTTETEEESHEPQEQEEYAELNDEIPF